MIVKTKRQVEVEARTIRFASSEDALEVLAGYFGLDVTKLPRNVGGDAFRKRYGAVTHAESQALAYAAVSDLFDFIAGGTDAEVTETLRGLGVEMRVPSVIEPTWTTPTGVTRPIRELPTRYLRNIEGKAQRMAGTLDQEPVGHGSGLVRAIRAELARRDA